MRPTDNSDERHAQFVTTLPFTIRAVYIADLCAYFVRRRSVVELPSEF